MDNDTCRTNVLPKTNDKKKLKHTKFRKTAQKQKEHVFMLAIIFFSISVLIGFCNHYPTAYEGGVPDMMAKYYFSWENFWRLFVPQYIMILFGLAGMITLLYWI